MNNYPSMMLYKNSVSRQNEIRSAVASERLAIRVRAGQELKPPVLRRFTLLSIRGIVGRILINTGSRIAGVATPTATSQTTSTAKS